VPKGQLKLMAVVATPVLLGILVSALLAERGLRRNELARTARSLEERASLVRELIGPLPPALERSRALDARVDRAAGAAEARVTLIAPDGRVVSDSDVSFESLDRMANHSDRPEVQEALQGRVGVAARRSATLGSELFYLAIPGSEGGVVRLAVGLPRLEAATAELRREILAAGAVGLTAAIGLASLLSWLALRPFWELRRVAEAIASGRLEYRPRLRARSELKEIADALHHMAEQLQLRLKEVTGEKERLRAVLDAMVEGVLVVDEKNEVLLANRRLRELFDAWGEIDGRTPIEAIRHAEVDAVLREARATDLPVSRAVAVGRVAPRTIRVHAVRFPSGSGPRHGSVAVFHDITEIARLDQVRRDFVANASHELRTPLAAIRGFTETLLSRSDLGEADRRSYLEIIERHARRLGNLVGDLLELSRIESRKPGREPSSLDVAAIAEGLIHDSRTRFAEKELRVSLERRGDARVWAERQAVEQILLNLLDNAVKYTEPRGRIEIGIETGEESVRISVGDTGIGIPRRDLERIFERFYRVDKARSRALGGTGLGLSIVKHLVQSLGGEITVESALGVGTTFTFTLPRARPAPERAAPRSA